MYDDQPYGGYEDIELDNNAQRLPLVLCLDTSSSMSGNPIEELNAALAAWTGELRGDVSLSQSVEIAVITFGGNAVTLWQGSRQVSVQQGAASFVPAHSFEAPKLQAAGVTLLTEALELAIRLVADRKSELRSHGLGYYRPQICMLTDGQPTDARGNLTDSWKRLVPVLAQETEARRFRLFAIGVGGMKPQGEQVLAALAPEFNMSLRGFPFRQLLQMMSASAGAEQRGAGDEVFKQIFRQYQTQRPADEIWR